MRRRHFRSGVLRRESENGATAGGLAREAERCVEILNGGVALRGIKDDDGGEMQTANGRGNGGGVRGGIDWRVISALQGHQGTQKRKVVKLVPDIARNIG